MNPQPRTAASPRKTLLVAAALVLCGCHSGQSAEDRINAALPPGTEIIAARSALDALVKPQSPDARALEDDYRARLKVRALECGHGYQPNAFAGEQAIRDALTDKDCFAKADRNLLEWLAGRRIGLLLSAPPLRPIPATAPYLLIAGGPIGEVSFAERAGVVLVTSGKHFQTIDMGTGATISEGDSDYLAAQNLSPNGRLFVLPREGARIEVRETQSGAVLASFDQLENNAFTWVGDAGAIFKHRGAIFGDNNPSAYPVFLDFASGKLTPIPIVVGAVSQVLALPGSPHRYVVLAGNRLAVVELRQNAQGWDAVMLSERALPSPSWWTNAGSGLTADGRVFFRTGKSLELLNLTTLDLKTVTFDPMGVQGAVATADPDVLVLNVRINTPLGAGSLEQCLYSLSQRTLAKVDTARLLSPRIIYIPSLRRNAVIDDSKIAMIDSIPAAAPIAINDYIEQRTQAVAALQTGGQAAPIAVGSDTKGAGANGAAIAARIPVYPGPVAELGKTADVEAIGVYEGTNTGNTAGAARREGVVQVLVKRSAQPLILSLSSYESVRWQLTLEPGAKLAAVLSSSYNPSEVIGAGSARVYQMGTEHAYKRDTAEFAALDGQVLHWTGKDIGVFQGTYTGGSFSVGQ